MGVITLFLGFNGGIAAVTKFFGGYMSNTDILGGQDFTIERPPPPQCVYDTFPKAKYLFSKAQKI